MRDTKNMEILRVLQVMGSLKTGGAETMIMNVYRAIDREKLQFDFLVYEDQETPYSQEVAELGGRILLLRRGRHLDLIDYYRKFRTIVQHNGPYIALHSHCDYHSAIPILFARVMGIKTRIAHAHSTMYSLHASKLKRAGIYLSRFIFASCATRFLACGEEASCALFGRGARQEVFPNAIDVARFASVDDLEIDQCRRELGVADDELLVGSVASFREAKNHEFIVRIASSMKEAKIPFKMVLVGEGVLFSEIHQLVTDMGLEASVEFLGLRDDIPLLMSTFDVLLMPSLYEGLPVTLIEAQAAGLGAVISDNISDEVDMGLGLIRRLPLEASRGEWIRALGEMATRKRVVSAVERGSSLAARGYDIHTVPAKVYRLYGVGE